MNRREGKEEEKGEREKKMIHDIFKKIYLNFFKICFPFSSIYLSVFFHNHNTLKPILYSL